MPRQFFNQRFSIDLDVTVEDQQVPIIGSESFRRFSIQIENAGDGVSTLMGSMSGTSTRVTRASIVDEAGVLDSGKTNKTGFSALLDSGGNAVFSDNGDGLYTIEIATALPGGLLLDFSGFAGEAGDKASVTVIMSCNAKIPGSPRGA